MDQILRGLLKSQEPEQVRRELVNRIKQLASRSNSTRVIHEIFNITTAVILGDDVAFNVDICKDVYCEWARYNRSSLASFWTLDYLDLLLDGKSRNTANIMWLLYVTFPELVGAPEFKNYCKLVHDRITGFTRENPSFAIMVMLCKFLIKFKQCIPQVKYNNFLFS